MSINRLLIFHDIAMLTVERKFTPCNQYQAPPLYHNYKINYFLQLKIHF